MGLFFESQKYFLLPLLILCFSVSSVSACLEISEVHARDPEWVEIHNPCAVGINLSGWIISDIKSSNLITCYTSPGCSLETNSTHFIIIDRATNITDVTQEEVVYFFVDDKSIGSGLNNNVEEINFSNSSYFSFKSY